MDNSWSNACLGSSESVSKLYTNFEFFLKINTYNTQKHIDLWSQTIDDDKINTKKSLHVLEDNASVVQVGDIEQIIVLNLFKMW